MKIVSYLQIIRFNQFLWIFALFLIKNGCMILTGTFVNVATVTIGSTLGLLIGNKINQRYKTIVFQALGLFTLFLGVQMAFDTNNPLIMVFSLIIGGLIGEWMQIDTRLKLMGEGVRKRVKVEDSRFSEGLITAFMIFCIGSMTILGAIEEGLGNPPRLLLTKSLMDGFSSMALASVLGRGVLFSVVPLFIFQGGLTLLAMWSGDYISEVVMNELIAVGGIILIGLGINILEIKQLRVINLLPALIFVVIFTWLQLKFL